MGTTINLKQVKAGYDGAYLATSTDAIEDWLKAIRKLLHENGAELDEDSKDYLCITEFTLIGQLERLEAVRAHDKHSS